MTATAQRTNTARAKILVVDDEPDIVSLLQYNLEKEGYAVSTACNGLDALLVAQEQNPDLILLDVMMPGLDGYETCRRLRSSARHAHTPILFLTARTGEGNEIQGLEMGADDYIQKPTSPRLILAHIRTILRRSNDNVRTETIAMPETLTLNGITINRQNYTLLVDGKEIFLPKKEFELLAFLAGNPGKTFPRDMLLKRVWGESVFVVDRTVDVHISKIREKLGHYGDLIETVKGLGYRFRS